MTVFEELQKRGIIAQTTHEEKIKNILENEKVIFYTGFDATADSLHAGHLVPLIAMRHMQRAGHIPIALLGTGTTLVGDPTDRTDMRKMMTGEEIEYNAECYKKQMANILDFNDGNAMLEKNGDWLKKLGYIDFLRDAGRYFSVNKMLTAECFKSRLEKGLSFLEFNYMLMQSYDFLHLCREHDCKLQLGGDDQWANILGGVDLVRRVLSKEVYGMTFSLLLTKDNRKMGKTAKGALWLDGQKTSPYEFFQYWRNISDDDVINCLKMLTFLPLDEIEAMENREGEKLNHAKEILAEEVTRLIHGEQEAAKALETSRSLFSSNRQSEDMPATDLGGIDESIALTDAMAAAGLVPSKSEARRVIAQGGVSVDGEKVSDFNHIIKKEEFEKGYVIIKKVKKIYHKLIVGS